MTKAKLETHQPDPIEGLDKEVRDTVFLLRKNGVETFASCQGGDKHSYPEPTIRFFGQREEGYRAAAIALAHGLPIRAVRRTWPIEDGELHGPYWEMVFWKKPG